MDVIATLADSTPPIAAPSPTAAQSNVRADTESLRELWDARAIRETAAAATASPIPRVPYELPRRAVVWAERPRRLAMNSMADTM
jgi:hypothetical protein